MRKVSRIIDMSCYQRSQQVVGPSRSQNPTYFLSLSQLAVSHDIFCELIHNSIISCSEHVRPFGGQCWFTKFISRAPIRIFQTIGSRCCRQCNVDALRIATKTGRKGSILRRTI